MEINLLLTRDKIIWFDLYAGEIRRYKHWLRD